MLVGLFVGLLVGPFVGLLVGIVVPMLGCGEGWCVGLTVGDKVGDSEQKTSKSKAHQRNENLSRMSEWRWVWHRQRLRIYNLEPYSHCCVGLVVADHNTINGTFSSIASTYVLVLGFWLGCQ